MAGSNEIRQKIVLEGEQQYKQALKDAQRNLKTLRSELKAETAEMGRNASEAQKSEAKLKNLKKQIAEQEKVVKAYREALKEVKEKYGDNADAVAKWEQKLNDARTSLANMKNELDGVGDGFKELQQDANMATVASKAVADTLGNLANVGETISNSIEGIFTGMVQHIKSAVMEVWGIIADTAAKANNWTDLAGIYNSSTTKIQEWYNALGATGGEGKFNEFVSFTSKLAAGGEEQWKKVAENFGISRENYEDDMQYAWDVIAAAAEYRNKNGQKAYEAAMKNAGLGKKGDTVGWMISNWDKINENRQEFIDNGYNMGEESIATLNDVQLQIFEIDQKWEALKGKIAEGLGTVTLTILTNVNNALDAIMKYFNAETEAEREAAYNELKESILNIFNAIRDAIKEGIALLDQLVKDLEGSDDPTEKALATILGAIRDALEWFTEDHMDDVVNAFKGLIELWAGAKALTMVSRLASLAASAKTLGAGGALSTLGRWLGFGNGGGGNGTNPTVPTTTPTAAPTGGGGDGGVGTAAGGSGLAATLKAIWASGGGASMLTPFAVAAAGILPSVFANNWDKNNINQRTAQRLANAAGMGSGGWWLESMANALGLNGTGMESDYAAQGALLMGMADRGDMEKARLLGALAGRSSGGYNAASELLSYWQYGAAGVDDQGRPWDQSRITQLAEVVADAYPAFERMGSFTDSLPSADWWMNQSKNSESQVQTNEQIRDALNVLPGQMAHAVSGIKVYMDKEEVGHLVSPYIDQELASRIIY